MADVVEHQRGPGQGGTKGQRADALRQLAVPGLVLDGGQPAVGLLLGGAAEATDPGGDKGAGRAATARPGPARPPSPQSARPAGPHPRPAAPSPSSRSAARRPSSSVNCSSA